jgi:hypothetical protein
MTILWEDFIDKVGMADIFKPTGIESLHKSRLTIF